MTKKKSLVGIEKLITKFLACCNWWKCVPLIETYFSCKSTKPILVTNAPQTPRSPIWKRVAGPKWGRKQEKCLLRFKLERSVPWGNIFPLFSLKHDRSSRRKMEGSGWLRSWREIKASTSRQCICGVSRGLADRLQTSSLRALQEFSWQSVKKNVMSARTFGHLNDANNGNLGFLQQYRMGKCFKWGSNDEKNLGRGRHGVMGGRNTRDETCCFVPLYF